MKHLLLILALLLPSTLLADTFRLDYFHPTEREDNTPLLPEEIDHYDLKVNGITIDTINGSLNTVIFDITKPGNYQVTIATVDTQGRSSVDAVALVMEVFVKNPKPATGLTLTKLY